MQFNRYLLHGKLYVISSDYMYCRRIKLHSPSNPFHCGGQLNYVQCNLFSYLKNDNSSKGILYVQIKVTVDLQGSICA